MESYQHLDGMVSSDITDLNLLSMLFSLTLEEEKALHLAEEILGPVGSLSQVIQMSAAELHDLMPTSPQAVTVLILMRLSILRIVNERTSDQLRINSPAALAEYVAIHRNPTSGGNRRLVLLDRDSRLIRDLALPVSGTDLAVCRSIAQEALKADAFGLIVIDYLYKDDLYFSPRLNSLIDVIEKSMQGISINLLDYLIVGINRFYSKKGNKEVTLY